MRGWIKGLIGRWETLSQRRVILHHFDRLHEAAGQVGDVRLAELVELVHDAWVTGQTDAAIHELSESRRRRLEQAAQARRRWGA